MSVPSGYVTGKRVLCFEKLSAMITSLGLWRKMGLYVGKQIVFPLPNFTTYPAFEKLLTLFKEFQQKVFWFREPWNLIGFSNVQNCLHEVWILLPHLLVVKLHMFSQRLLVFWGLPTNWAVLFHTEVSLSVRFDWVLVLRTLSTECTRPQDLSLFILALPHILQN